MKYSVKRMQSELAHSICSHARVFVHCVCILCTTLVLSSCEKPLMSEEVSDDADGNLRVTVFEIEKTPFGSFTRATNGATTRPTNGTTNRAAKPVSEACTRLNYVIYTSDGTRVKQINKTSDDPNFATATFQLEEGNYLLVVVGHSSSGNPTMTDPQCIKFTNSQGFTDTFIRSVNITIAEEPVDYQASLDRITALCRFVLTDESIPAEVKKMRFYYTGGSGAFDATTGLGCVNSKQDVKLDVSADNKQFDLYTFLHDTEGTIHLTVSALDASGNELNKREFDVPMEVNHITWLSGNFFNGSTGTGSTTITGVTVNTDWAGETHLTF